MTLTLVPPPTAPTPPVKAPNDLPVSWDGHAVSWGPWTLETPGSLAYHLPLDALACTVCGSLAPAHWHATGARAVLPSITLAQIETAYAAGKGGKYALRTLFATRCYDCAHDQVYDLDANELWDLDPDDYADAGSIPPGTEQGALW